MHFEKKKAQPASGMILYDPPQAAISCLLALLACVSSNAVRQ
jgi:NO-binding membrane sensor protein with MHYT domain